jgi:hypothetical protein
MFKLKFANIPSDYGGDGGTRQKAHFSDHQTDEIGGRYVIVQVQNVDVHTFSPVFLERIDVRLQFGRVFLMQVCVEKFGNRS